MQDEKNNKVVHLERYKHKKRVSWIYTVLAIVILGIFFYQIYKINYNPVKTEIAFLKTVSNHLDTETFIVRDETSIVANASGTLVPLVEDGKRVASGDNVAVVFENEAAARVYNELGSIQEDIQYFSSLQNKIGANTSDVEAMNERIYSACEAYITAVDLGISKTYVEEENQIRDAITSRQLSTGVVIDPSDKLSALNEQLGVLKAQEGGYTTIAAGNPGYYISHVDGYENVVDYKRVEEISTGEIEQLLNGTTTPNPNTENCMGKLVDGFNWYLLCLMDYENVAGVKIGGKITVEFLGAAAEPIEAEVLKINDSINGKCSVILKCNLMNTKYAGLRLEKVRVVFNTYTGLEIDNRAIREVDGQKGVFVQSGNIIKFKKIDIAYADSERSICVTPDGESGYLKLYDEVIVEGTDLYDGKILH